MSMNLATISIVNVLPTRPQRSLVLKEWSLSPWKKKNVYYSFVWFIEEFLFYLCAAGMYCCLHIWSGYIFLATEEACFNRKLNDAPFTCIWTQFPRRHFLLKKYIKLRKKWPSAFSWSTFDKCFLTTHYTGAVKNSSCVSIQVKWNISDWK